jgi:short-subunit dehydrogenase
VSATYPFTRALVTGASSGIGEELTRQLATAGVPTVVVARRVERLEALAGELTGVEVLEADLVTDAGVTAVGARITDAERPVDLVVNNAGFGTSGEFHTLDPDRLADEVDLNVATLTRLSHIALSMMIERRRGW